MQMEIKLLDEDRIRSLLGNMSKKAPTVISRVINRVVTNVKKNISISVRKRYVVKTGDIKKTLSSSKATSSKLSAYVKSEGIKIPLYKFRVSPKEPRPKNPPKSFKAKVLKSSSLKPLQGFVAKMKSGHVSYFERSNKNRLPIKELYGPAIPQMIGQKEVWKNIEKDANETVEKRMVHEINRLLENQ